MKVIQPSQRVRKVVAVYYTKQLASSVSFLQSKIAQDIDLAPPDISSTIHLLPV